jgi:LuxR family maltose regulon positive regulatory protein
LLERLNNGLAGSFTLVSAPAGFGKTTLVSEWIQQLDIPTAWLSLDADDDDLHRFLTYFVTALQHIAPDIGVEAQDVLNTPPPLAAERLLTSLINDISALRSQFVCVLDDYQFIQHDAIHRACTMVIEQLPPAMHLVIITRTDPPLPIHRLRVRQRMTEIRAADLRFSVQDTTAFLNDLMELNLSIDDATVLSSRTEGWITGLHLAALSLQRQQDRHDFVTMFAGDDRYIADYLLNEVLAQQPAAIQHFLLATCILERFCSSLCDAVVGTARSEPQPDSPLYLTDQSWSPEPALASEDNQALLEYLERSNLFIVPLDNRQEWYRYHHLFADLLQKRLYRIDQRWVAELHRRAAAWYQQHNLVDEALRHLLAAREFTKAALFIQQQGIIMFWQSGQTISILRWLRQFPSEHMYAHPRLCLLAAWAHYIIGCYDEVEPLLCAAEAHWQLFGTASTAQSSDVQLMQGEVALLRAFVSLMRGAHSAATTAFATVQRVLDELPTEQHHHCTPLAGGLAEVSYLMGDTARAKRLCQEVLPTARATGRSFLALLCLSRLTDVAIIEGQLHEAAHLCQRMHKMAAESGQPHLLADAWADVMLSRVLYEWNDLTTARQLVQYGIERGRQAAMYRIVVEGLIVLAHVLHAQQDIAGAWEAVQEALHMTSTHHVLQDWGRLSAALCQMRLWLHQEDLSAARHYERELQPLTADSHWYQHELYLCTKAHLLIMQGEEHHALALLNQLRQEAEASGRRGRLIEILALQALAYQVQGDTSAALAVLEQALTMAKPQGYVRLFVDKGPLMVRLLTRLKEERSELKSSICMLLAASGSYISAVSEQVSSSGIYKSNVQSTMHQMVEPLSDREMEVLRLLGAGFSNQEIARELVLARGTIKVHISHIYQKLNVRSRTQAVAKAQTLGIL